jgi:CRISPR system Cascade subunit CasC
VTATVELHVIQSWPTSLLNRDEHQQPKETWFGGVRRIRVASQSLKRAQRLHFAAQDLVPRAHLGTRTKGLPRLLTKVLRERGHDSALARDLAINTVWGMGVLDLDAKNAAKQQTNVLLFVADGEVARIADLIDENLGDVRAHLVPADTVLEVAGKDAPGDQEQGADGQAPVKTRSKRERKEDCPEPLKLLGRTALQSFDPGKAVDIALFGRMLAEQPDVNVDGACDVAHAIGVHEAVLDIDYFTAVDDLSAAEGKTGSAHLDTAVLTAPVLYRYAALNTDLLRRNLHGDDSLTDLAVTAWIDATIFAQPAAKHTSTAAWTVPSLIVGVVRDNHPLSLVNAFATPVAGDYKTGLVEAAVAALAQHWTDLGQAYGDRAAARGVWHTLVGEQPPGVTLPGERLNAADLADRLTGFTNVARKA